MSVNGDGGARAARHLEMSAAAAGRRLAWATAAERAGIWATVLVLAVDAWTTFGPGAVGLVAASRSLASAAGAPVCSMLADSHRPRDLLVGARACAAALVAAIALAIDLEAGLATLCALAALLGVVGSVCDPAGGLLRVRLVGDDENRLAVATARHRLAVHCGFLIGSVSAGLLMTFGTGAALLPAAASFAVGAVLAATVRSASDAGVERPPQGLLRGARLVAGTRVLRAAFGGLALLVAVDAIAYAAGSAVAGALAASLGARSEFAVAGTAALATMLVLAVPLRRAGAAVGSSMVRSAALVRAS